jgi:predicted CoA-binding protein
MARTVAVVGASSDRSKFGNKALRAFQSQGYTAIPINPNEPTVEGLTAYKSVLDVPGPIDMATVYVQPDIAMRLLDEFDQKGIGEVWINPGAETDAMLAQAKTRRAKLIFACSILGVGRSPHEF